MGSLKARGTYHCFGLLASGLVQVEGGPGFPALDGQRACRAGKGKFMELISLVLSPEPPLQAGCESCPMMGSGGGPEGWSCTQAPRDLGPLVTGKRAQVAALRQL